MATSAVVPQVRGLILAGGKSSRMGVDKCELTAGGKPLKDVQFSLLSKFCSNVSFSCREPRTALTSFQIITDRPGVEGPLAGILSALDTDPGSAWLIMPVDMVGACEDSVRYLLEQRDPLKPATAFIHGESRMPEPLFALWEPPSLPMILRQAATGDFSVMTFLMTHPVHLVPCPDRSWLTSVNSPEEWQGWLHKRLS
jgi:molybdopterin-guanine dinucleotide biosynthesis protein A